MLIDFKKFESYKGTSPAALARDTVMFAAAYVVLDWTSYIYPLGPFNITPWNPAPALSIVWMYFFFSQYLIIWYGNVPLETRFFVRAFLAQPWAYLAWAIFIVGWLIPFSYLLKRLFWALPTLFGVAIVVFVLLRVVPGDPIAMMVPPGAHAEDIARLREMYGLNTPIYNPQIHYDAVKNKWIGTTPPPENSPP